MINNLLKNSVLIAPISYLLNFINCVILSIVAAAFINFRENSTFDKMTDVDHNFRALLFFLGTILIMLVVTIFVYRFFMVRIIAQAVSSIIAGRYIAKFLFYIFSTNNDPIDFDHQGIGIYICWVLFTIGLFLIEFIPVHMDIKADKAAIRAEKRRQYEERMREADNRVIVIDDNSTSNKRKRIELFKSFFNRS